MAAPLVVTRRTLLGAVWVGASAEALARAPAPRAPRPLVMLDPGHGGKDPGAVGAAGTFEKHIALATAIELRRQLEAGGRCRVELTRRGDVFVPLEERVRRAQWRGAALLVSLHADALPDRGVRGASVYTLSNTASDAQTEALAQRENSADRFDPGGRGVPPVVNEESSAELLHDAMAARRGPGSVEGTEQSLGGEDFSWYLEHVPGAMARLGVRTPGERVGRDLHQGDFDVDESAITVGVEMFTAAALLHVRGH